eukprot:TRINITY_DN14832_c1_g4_i1.p1 TRINITY_DN14832_c1_g4~~TRINITY_DN14832_c1_g4_i1.p1  ORF type:complete len:191 (+),score=21.45 TRINITY_DN14832_c1_g4_i1:59-631(+)
MGCGLSHVQSMENDCIPSDGPQKEPSQFRRGFVYKKHSMIASVRQSMRGGDEYSDTMSQESLSSQSRNRLQGWVKGVQDSTTGEDEDEEDQWVMSEGTSSVSPNASVNFLDDEFASMPKALFRSESDEQITQRPPSPVRLQSRAQLRALETIHSLRSTSTRTSDRSPISPSAIVYPVLPKIGSGVVVGSP